jgi:DNA-binding winged helix-turn-helix (wHTH) protein
MRVGFDRFTFDSETRELLEEGRRLHLSPKAFDVLQVLLEKRPRVVAKMELHDRVWSGAFIGDANLSVAIAELRRVLGDDSRDGRLIRTVHRVGYAFSGAASDLPPVSSPVPPSWSWLSWNDKSLQLVEGENIVGRDPRCTVWIDASGVSRRHARIIVSGAQARIEDLGSSNGTFIRGTRITSSHPLADGDRIELGSTAVTFREWSDDRPPKTERIKRNAER